MYFKIDEDDRIILCPQNDKDLEKLERVYHKMKHKGLEQIEIVLELPKEGQNKKYYDEEHQQRMRQQMEQFGFNPQEMEQAVGDNFEVSSHFWPYVLPFFMERYGYDRGRDGYNRSGEYGRRDGWNENYPDRKGGDGIVGERGRDERGERDGQGGSGRRGTFTNERGGRGRND
jgi:hypothetical protein